MSNREPRLVTDPKLADVLTELVQQELIFHHSAVGMTRADFERMTDNTFWEVGASGRRYLGSRRLWPALQSGVCTGRTGETGRQTG